MSDEPTLLIIALVFLAAGGIKGVVGFGLPTLSLAVFVLLAPLPTAMALMLLPSLVTNIWQALQGGHLVALCLRFRLLFITAFGAIFLTAGFVTPDLEQALRLLLGMTIGLYALVTWLGLKLSFVHGRERGAGLAAGILNGCLTGLTGAFVVPGVFYLQAAGLDRNQLVQAMGILFTVSTLGLLLALGDGGHFSQDEARTSAWGILPAIVGMVAGQRLRHRMPEALFRQVFLLALAALGGYICLRALTG